MGSNPSENKCDNCPIETVSWDDIQVFLGKLNARTSKKYRLPTEAEWEYAAKGGGNYTYAGSNTLDEVAWYDDNSDYKTHEVMGKNPNGYGLYDMSGNVSEWCSDRYDSDYYKNSPVANPTGAGSRGYRGYRVLRGGGCSSSAECCRSSDRGATSTLRTLPTSTGFGWRLTYS
jgi:formylglycine-generating enzyme required for sulfatase activity